MHDSDCLLWLSFFVVSFLLGMISFSYHNRRIDTAIRSLPDTSKAAPSPACRTLIELTFAKTGTLLSAQMNLNDTLYAVCDMVADMLGCSSCLITLVNDNDATLTVASSYGLNAPPASLPRATSLSGQVLTAGQPRAVNHLDRHPELFCPPLVFSQVTALICAPLCYSDTLLGTIEAYAVDGREFTEHDLLLLSALARHSATAINNARQHESVKRSLEEEKLLSKLARLGASSIDPTAILTDSAHCVQEALSALWCLPALAVTADTYEWLTLPDSNRQLTIDEASPMHDALVHGEIALLTDCSQLPFPHLAPQLLLIPLICNQESIGLLLCGLSATPFTKQCFAELIARRIAFGLQKAQLYNQVKSMALSDGLTGLANRRNFDMLLKTELRRSASLNRHLSLIMLDLDKFKSYNDTYGHLTGDKLLAQVGQIIHHNIRSIDLAARYGGEEFSIILPECSAADAYAIAEKLRHTIETSHFPDSLGTFTASITASVGVTTYDPTLTTHPPDSEKIIALADKALYQAKENGRNRICANTNFS